MSDVVAAWSLAERRDTADLIRRLRPGIAQAVTEEFLARHPDWLARYGERARTRGLDDACFHLDFLAGAVEAGSPDAFADYTRWTARMLSARGIAPRFLAENIEQIAAQLVPRLPEAQRSPFAAIVAAGVTASASPPALVPPAGEGALALSRSLFLQAILVGSRPAAMRVALEALADGSPLLDVYVEVLQAALYEVGRLWEVNQITVAHEHIATAIVQHTLAHLYLRLQPATVRRGRAVVTGVEGELHQVGAHMVADALESDGWDVRFLGTALPHAGILDTIASHRAHVLGVSATLLAHLPDVRALVTGARAATSGLHVLVGGRAFQVASSAWRDVGADAVGSDLRDAVGIVRPWAVAP